MENVIEHKFYSDEVFFVYPQGEVGNFLTDMIVKVIEGQSAYLVSNKKVIKELRMGTNSILEAFSGFVVFLAKKDIQKKWGTLEPVPFRDKSNSLIYVKAYGTIDFLIKNGEKFIERFIREKDLYLTEEFVDFLRNLISYEFYNILKERKDYSNGQENLRYHLEELMKERLGIIFNEIGLKLLNFNIVGSNIFEEEKEVEKQSKFCKNCSKEIFQDANFCPYCGEKISNFCLSCQKEIPEFAKFCPFCGKKV